MTRDEAIEVVGEVLVGLHTHPEALAAEVVDTLIDAAHPQVGDPHLPRAVLITQVNP